MLYSKHITFPKNQTQTTPTITQFRVNRGIIYRIWLGFPSGCANFVKLKVFHEGHPFLPSQEDEYITGDNFTYVYPPFHEIKSAPELITVKGWNEDDTFDHTISFQMLVLKKKYVMPIGAHEGIIAALRSLFVQRY